MKNNQIRRVLITGGTSGLGFQIVNLLLKEGFIVCATGRNLHKGRFDSDRFYFVKTDFSNLSDVILAVNKITEFIGVPDIIINNAGILSPPDFTLSNEGIELSFQVNFLSHLVLNDRLVRTMLSEKKIQIISVTSPVYRYVKPGYKLPEKNNYSASKVYTESKYYILLLGRYLVDKYPGKKIEFIGFNPGIFRSGIYRTQKKYFHTLYHIAAPFMKSPVRVAENLVKIINNDNLVADKVYSSLSKWVEIGDMRKEESLQFMTGCVNMVSEFMR